MDNNLLLGEWDNERQIFWFGANNREYIGRKGDLQILITTANTPTPELTGVVQSDKLIHTLEDFSNALQYGTERTVQFTTPVENRSEIQSLDNDEEPNALVDFETAFDAYKAGDKSRSNQLAILQEAYAFLEDENFHTGIEVIEQLTGIKYL